MSGGYGWTLALLGLVAIAAWPIRRWLVARSGRLGAEDPLVDWVVALRAAEDPAETPEPHLSVACVAQGRSGLRTPVIDSGPPAASRPPGWRGSRRPPVPAFGAAPSGPRTPARTLGIATVSSGSSALGSGSSALVVGTSSAASAALLGRPVADRHTSAQRGNPSVPTSPPAWAVRPRRTLLLTVLLGAGLGGVLAGTVAAVALGGYGALGARALLRHGAAARATQDRRDRLDQLCALAADLRAGLPVPVAAERLGLSGPMASIPAEPAEARPHEPAPGPDGPDDSHRRTGTDSVAEPSRAASGRGAGTETGIPSDTEALPDRPGRLAQAAVRLADRTGAPLAELVERIEADARSTDRGLAAAAAQAAGARATAWLLAALPLGGIGLGYGIGVDPLDVLLHTPIGGGCAIVAVALQVVGLLWADRLGAVPAGVG